MALAEVDPEIMELCKSEKHRQRFGLELIASENFVSRAVLEAMSSSFHNKYSEGQVGKRYYAGNLLVDKMETLCQTRALNLFNLDKSEWGVNVQPYSGSPANFAIFTALVGPHGRIMGLDLPDGGHLTHGFQTASGKKVSATSLFFESMPYKVNPVTGLIDYDGLEFLAKQFRPKLIIAGTSAYARKLDYARFRRISDSVSAFLLADISHISGLMSAGLHPSAFDYCDVVMSTSHKTLRGPRAGMIFYRKVPRIKKDETNSELNGYKADPVFSTDFERLINEAVFPGLQGGPHNHTIAALAVALKEASSLEFKNYQHQVVKNMQQLCTSLTDLGYKLVSGGSDTHLCLMDLRHQGVSAAKAEKVLELIGVTVNKNTCPGDVNAIRPSGIRLGTPALTSRGLVESDIAHVAEFIDRGIRLTIRACQLANGKTMKDFETTIHTNNELGREIDILRMEVEKYAGRFPIPGLDY